MTTRYWAIVDEEGNVIGKWEGSFHIVMIYERKSEALVDAVSLHIPKFKIVRAEIAMQCKQSKYSL